MQLGLQKHNIYVSGCRGVGMMQKQGAEAGHKGMAQTAQRQEVKGAKAWCKCRAQRQGDVLMEPWTWPQINISPFKPPEPVQGPKSCLRLLSMFQALELI